MNIKPLKKKLQRVIILPDGETYEFFVDCFYADLTEAQAKRLRDGESIDTLIDEGIKLRLIGDDVEGIEDSTEEIDSEDECMEEYDDDDGYEDYDYGS
jgi:hypothetical protein